MKKTSPPRHVLLWLIALLVFVVPIPRSAQADEAEPSTGRGPDPGAVSTAQDQTEMQASAPVTDLISVASDGTQTNGVSSHPSISADGRYIAFRSSATNLVAGDTNGRLDIFVRDRLGGQTERASVATSGLQGNGSSRKPFISANGRYVVFESDADNLVPGDSNASTDIFVRDLQLDETARVSVSTDGVQGNRASTDPAISADGRYVSFISLADDLVPDDTNNFYDVFVRDLLHQRTTRVTVATGNPYLGYPVAPRPLSDLGRHIAFLSDGSLFPPDANGALWDVFRHNLETEQTARVSVASDGTQANDRSGPPAIATDGHHVAFDSVATNLVSGDANGSEDVFVHDLRNGRTVRVSVASDGTPGNANSDFETASQGLSSDGRYVAFTSYADNLVPGDTQAMEDVFVHDRDTDGDRILDESGRVRTTRVSVGPDGWEANGPSDAPSISADGRYVAFHSTASNLVADDTNRTTDVFVHDRAEGAASTTTTVDTGNKILISWACATTVSFPPGAFTEDATVTHTGYYPARHPAPAGLTGLGRFFDLTGTDVDTGQPVQPVQPYTIQVAYHQGEAAVIAEDTLALYVWDGSAWVREPTSTVDVVANTVTATPDHFSSWAVLGETQRVFLPLVLRSR